MEKTGNPLFGFGFTLYEEIVKEVNSLKIKKVSQKADIPVRIVKENIDIVSYFLYHNFNSSLSCSTFLTAMKYAEVTPIYKKDDKTDKENYCPITILSNLSKVYERLMYNQTYPYFQIVFSKFQGGYHNLLIAKLNAYGFEEQLNAQRTKVDSAVSSWEMLLSSVPQDSVLGQLLFSIYICDMFLETPANIGFAGYVDDNTPYTYSSNIKNVLYNLKEALEKMFHWFSSNNLGANARECHLLTSPMTHVDMHISNTEILNEARIKLLVVNFEGKLKFDSQVNTDLKKSK